MKKHFLLLWLLFFGSIGLAAAQNRQIQGVVKSAEGEALPGVTVLVEGTTNGASTGVDGSYSITLPAAKAAGAKLRFSFVGFVSKEVTVGEQTTINVSLAGDSKQLEDVVVIGYGEANRRDVTGAVSSVSAAQIKDIPVNSAAEALTGRLAGVQLTSSEGTPGADVRIRVRGGGSITQDNTPLYVVDGMQIENALSVISPQDIQSVDVLKDAAATAIYGARGANGVVIITTKNGIEGRTAVTYSGFAGVRRLVKTLDVLKPAEFIDYQYERSDAASFRSSFGSRNFLSDTIARAKQSPFTDWQDEVFGRDAFQQTHNLTVSGGGKGTVYSLSLTSNREQGIQLASDFDRKLLNFRLENKATDKLRIGFNVRLNDQTINGAGTASGGQSSSSRLRNTIQYRPFTSNLGTGVVLDPTEEDDDYFLASGGGTNGLINPIVVANAEYRREAQRLVNAGTYVNYNFTKGLSFRSTFGVDYRLSRSEAFNNEITSVARQNGNKSTASIGTGTQLTLNNSNVLTYKYMGKSKHHFDVLLGHEVYQTLNNSLNISTFYLPTGITPDKALANFNQAQAPAGFIQPSPTTNEDLSRILSGFSRLNYSFDDRYLFTGTLRVDASSKFGPNNHVGVFPAASVAWRLSRERFLQPYESTISDLKLRLSSGLAGNNRIANNLFRSVFVSNGIEYAQENGRTPGLATTSLPYTGLIWETTLSRNIGLDLALFNNRVQFTADAYYNSTYDLLITQPVPITSGYSTQLRNVGETSNRGIEFQLSGTVIQTPDFTWSANGNISFNRNRVEDLGGQPYLPGITSGWTADTGQDYWVAPGQPVGLMYGYVTDFDNGRKGFYTVDDFNATQGTNGTWTYKLKDGIANNNGVVADAAAGTGAAGQPLPGSMKFKDLNGDGVVDTEDRTVIGNANPKHTGGLNQQFAFKGFDASIFLNWSYGNDIYNANKINFTSAYLPNQNLLGIMRDRWRTFDAQGNRVTEPTALAELNKDAQIWRPTQGRYLLHSWAIEDGSFLRINNITVGYTLPKALVQRARLTTLRFYVTVNNVYTFTKYSGFDPEVNTRRGPLTPGVDYAAYPRSRAFLAGLNLTL
ncbi:MAG: TonB-dependent receptor [Hymenobacter sp.]|nr:TonB-dependent receptor [Hymenobacter sp.]